MKSLKIALCSFFLILGLAGFAAADLVTVDAAGGLTVDGTVYQLLSDKPADPGPTVPDGTGLMWEWNAGKGVWKNCLCRMVTFRAMQALGQQLSLDAFNSADTDILTGWNTDGPEELLIENMPWVEGTNFHYADSITGNVELTQADAWFQVTIKGMGTYKLVSAASNYAFTADENRLGYHEDWDFFDYRTYFKNGGTGDEVTYFSQYVRPQIVDNFMGETAFEVHATPIPGAVWLIGSGLFGILGIRKRFNR